LSSEPRLGDDGAAHIRFQPEGELCYAVVNLPRRTGFARSSGDYSVRRVMAARVVVFIDYQNVYQSARRAFHHPADPYWCGQVDPVRVAVRLAADSPFDRQLKQVRVYRGVPTGGRGYGASRRQHERWQRSPLVDLTLRPLRYPSGSPQEKGIDVALAVDFVVMAVRNQFDVGILMSTDTDLMPAIEFVVALTGTTGPRAEVAAWSLAGHAQRLASKSRNIYCHWLGADVYRAVADPTDYTKPR
jgi:hypothetical protein